MTKLELNICADLIIFNFTNILNNNNIFICKDVYRKHLDFWKKVKDDDFINVEYLNLYLDKINGANVKKTYDGSNNKNCINPFYIDFEIVGFKKEDHSPIIEFGFLEGIKGFTNVQAIRRPNTSEIFTYRHAGLELGEDLSLCPNFETVKHLVKNGFIDKVNII